MILRMMSFTGIKRKFTDNPNISGIKKIKTGSIPGLNFINYVPSLESIAVINIAIALCKQSDIRDALRQFYSVGNSTKTVVVQVGDSPVLEVQHDYRLRQLENSILNKFSLAPLPNSLKAKVANVVLPVLIQILKWIRDGRDDIEYIDSIHWTNEGTIDKVKTLKQLVPKDYRLYINNHFKSACRYCSEDDIHNLWHKLHKGTQKHYLHSKIIYNKYDDHLIAYWTSVLKNDLSELFHTIKPYDYKNLYDCNNSIYKNMFILAISQGNILAVKYFWNKLTAEEISYNLAEWVNDTIYKIHYSEINYSTYPNINKYSDVLFFLLSQMHNADQQGEVFQEYSAVILNSLFFNWPWQRFLLPTIQTIWSSLNEEDFNQFLSTVGKEIKAGKTTEKLLRELFQESPVNLKKCFIQCVINDDWCSTDVICNLLAVEDVQTVKLILNYANVEEKKQIIFSAVRSYKLYEVIYTNKLYLFDILIGETLSSESDIHNLKAKIIQEHGGPLCLKWIYSDNCQMLENFFDWAFTSQDQTDNFKNEILNKVEITCTMIKLLHNYELTDKFISLFLAINRKLINLKNTLQNLNMK